MDDATRKALNSQARSEEQKNYRHLQTDHRSVGISFENMKQIPAKQLANQHVHGGQAETVKRMGGSYR